MRVNSTRRHARATSAAARLQAVGRLPGVISIPLLAFTSRAHTNRDDKRGVFGKTALPSLSRNQVGGESSWQYNHSVKKLL